MRVRSLEALPPALRARARRQLEGRMSRSKYHAVPSRVDGIRFASQLEGRCYLWLKGRVKGGDVAWFIRQPSFDLPGGVRYVADFLAVRTGSCWGSCRGVEVIDAKGRDLPMGRLKRKQVEALYGVEVMLWHD